MCFEQTNKLQIKYKNKQRLQILLQLLLGTKVVAVTALLLTAVVSTRRKTSVALTANHLIAVVGLGEGSEGRFDDTTSNLEEHFNSSFFGNRVGAEQFVVFKFLASENQTLVVGVDIFSLLELLLNRLNGLGRLNFKGNSSSRNGLNKKMHCIERNIGRIRLVVIHDIYR